MNRIFRRFAHCGAPTLLAAMAAALLASAPAHAQYSWIDEHGTRVFSDRAPPPGTPANRILKAPRPSGPPPAGAPAVSPAPAAAAAPASGPMSPPARPQSVADREADYNKRQAQRQADDQKAQQEAARKADNQARCDGARQEQAQLASGTRIKQVDANGESGYVNDVERAKRMARAQQALADCQAAALNAAQ